MHVDCNFSVPLNTREQIFASRRPVPTLIGVNIQAFNNHAGVDTKFM